jgi:hypothetical protein
MCVTCCCLGHSCVNDYSLFFVGLTLWLSAAFFPSQRSFLENGSWKNLKSIDAKTRVRIHSLFARPRGMNLHALNLHRRRKYSRLIRACEMDGRYVMIYLVNKNVE